MCSNDHELFFLLVNWQVTIVANSTDFLTFLLNKIRLIESPATKVNAVF